MLYKKNLSNRLVQLCFQRQDLIQISLPKWIHWIHQILWIMTNSKSNTVTKGLTDFSKFSVAAHGPKIGWDMEPLRMWRLDLHIKFLSFSLLFKINLSPHLLILIVCGTYYQDVQQYE